ncbi:MAG TPA: 16S rRNA (guanine(966)-N(2))-methyltransferase RsmD [Dermatophilaceae bacterium]|jgi:16S rRNA (guanine966-N2)-methyltransferase|nr:16S rRNA (guanine(966)-N(2))-methyltransferase RsmD [Actinomycetales bacterium]HMT33520.1 16S rRNA (guanine(966)-N(2))-methyltransferase RsmD [Dermatophilaceae bacterium]HMT90545.1 16S rRNA (guanine(966)-N(2))-methyltransferase RsmD [Dermatophilaceae bacterium]
MTRIVSGSAGGRRLRTPAGSDTRPTSDRVREALFSRLDHLDVLAGARVLDLYAGSGALALEAMSRGAARALLVESDRAAAAVARSNAQALGWSSVVEVRSESVEKALLGGTAYPVDLVFLDPPYDLAEDRLGDVLALLVAHGWLAADALVVVERSSRSPQPMWPVGLAEAGERRYGETKVWFADAPGPDEVA